MQPDKANYQAWKINENDFPKHGSLEEQIRFLIGYGILAPSTHNSQPWKFTVNSDSLAIRPNFERSLNIGDPNSWGLFISLGASAENIVQAANSFGLKANVELQKNGLKIAFEKTDAQQNSRYLQNIVDRHSDKQEYLEKSIPEDIIMELERLKLPHIKINVINDKNKLTQITDNHLRAAKKVASNPKFALELSEWLRTNKTDSYDGMPGFVIGNSNFKSTIGIKLLKKKPQILKKLVMKDKKLLDSSPVIAIFSTPQPIVSKGTAMECGMAVERMWLALTDAGIVAHPLYASIQDNAAREQLANILGGDLTPLFFLRMGYSKNKLLHTPRQIKGNGNMSARRKLAEKLNVTEKQISVGKYAINYVVAGSGKPILLIHGANIGWPQWHLNISELAKEFKVYAIDLPGAGGSTKVNFHKTDFEKDFLNIVDQFITKLGLNKIDIVGSSFGGWITMRLAIENKSYINKIVVTNPIGFTTYMPVKFRPVSLHPFALFLSKTALKPVRKNKNLEKFMRDVFNDKNMPLDPDFVDYFYELSKESHNILFISRLAHFSGMRPELFLGDRLSQINSPTLVIWGQNDPLMPFSTVKDNFELIPNVQVKTLKEIGHMPPVEAASEFNKLVKEFLK